MDWEGGIESLVVGGELPEAEFEARETALVDQIRVSGAPILAVVTALGPHLTAESDVPRSRAVGLLAKASSTPPPPPPPLPPPLTVAHHLRAQL
jgi:hypothetical protein